jgi:hypothetical protein
MEHEGMVHALEEIRRLLKLGGVLVDIHPIPEGSSIEAWQKGRVLLSERERETCSENVLQAEKTLEQVVERELFIVDKHSEFDFLTYASSAGELRAYWKEQNAYNPQSKDEARVAREDYLYAQLEQILQVSGAGAEAVTHETARIARLRVIR